MRCFFKAAQRRFSSAAFTLAEVCIGAVIVLIVFGSIYAGLTMSFNATQAARENLRATQVMLERLEGLRLYNWEQLVYSNWMPSTFTAYYFPLTNQNQSPGILYFGTVTFSNVPFPNPAPNYANDLRLVTVTVYWTNTYGTNKIVRTRQMQTLVGRMGLQNYVYYN
jgi:type II secretory pathway pseudopilin PulG